MINWIAVTDKLPEDNQRILAFAPKNIAFLPGSLEPENREVLILRFLKEFYPKGSEKRAKHGAHFWLGEGQSNHFFGAISHWSPIPEGVYA